MKLTTKLVFVIAAVIVAVVLLAFKVISFETLMEEKLAIASAIVAIWKWIENDDLKEDKEVLQKENKVLNTEVEQLKLDNFRLSKK